MKQFDVPILFLTFNRPDLAEKSFSVIREQKPKTVYIASDGPRGNVPGELETVTECRKLVENMIDWPCEVHKLYRVSNLGCGKAVYEAISWFFDKEKMGIIIEDDCLLSDLWFPFAEQLLNKYEFNDEVMMISAINHFQYSKGLTNSSYEFAFYGGVWGWASWRKAWLKMDYELATLDTDFSSGMIKRTLKVPSKYINDRKKILEATKIGEIDTWDYQWGHARIKNNGLSIIPKNNLVINIGFDIRASHTFDPENWLSKLSMEELTFPLRHPKKIKRNISYDKKFLKVVTTHSKIDMKKMNLLRKFYKASPKSYITFLKRSLTPKRKNNVEQNFGQIQWEQITAGPAKEFELFLNKNSFSGWSSMLDGTYDAFIIEYLDKHIKIKDKVVCWDVGAHFGYSSLAFCGFNDSLIVYSFEPNPHNYKRLCGNVAHNGLNHRITTKEIALSNYTGTANFKISSDVESSVSTGSHLNDITPPRSKTLYDELNFEKISVAVDTADNLCTSEVKAPDFIKLDVEGAEGDFLEGARETFTQNKPVLVCEVHNVKAMYSVIQFLTSVNYKIEILDEVNMTPSRCFIGAIPSS